MPKPAYSPEFKHTLVEEHLKGGKSVAAVCREYHVGEVAFRCWRAQYQAGESQSAQGQAELARKLTAAQRRIAELGGKAGPGVLRHLRLQASGRNGPAPSDGDRNLFRLALLALGPLLLERLLRLLSRLDRLLTP